MPRSFALLPTLFLALLAPAGSTSAPTPQEKPGARDERDHAVVANVGAIEISRKDLLAETNRLIPLSYFHGKVARKKLAEFEAKALARLVEKALIYQEARALKIAATGDEQRKEMRAALKKAKPSAPEADTEQIDAMIRQYRPLLVKRILIDKNEKRFSATIPAVTDEMVRRYFSENHHEFLAPLEAHLRHILIKVAPTATESEIRVAKRKMDDARRQILAGKPFAKAAKAISQDEYADKGGDLGWVRQGSFLRGAIGKAAFGLKPGELTPVIDTIQGFHLAQCVARKPRRQLTEAEVHADLRRILEKRGASAARATWLDDLRRRFPVSTQRQNLPIAGPKSQKDPASPPSHGDKKRR